VRERVERDENRITGPVASRVCTVAPWAFSAFLMDEGKQARRLVDLRLRLRSHVEIRRRAVHLVAAWSPSPGGRLQHI
jgi:hypothetical protein